MIKKSKLFFHLVVQASIDQFAKAVDAFCLTGRDKKCETFNTLYIRQIYFPKKYFCKFDVLDY